MKENYKRTLDFIMKWEGAIVHEVKNDKGGLTSAYGLTLETMKKLKLDLNADGMVDGKDIYLVTQEVINNTFRKSFWNEVKGDELAGGIDLIIGDVAWNSGPPKAKQFIKEGFTNNITDLINRRILFYENIVKANPKQKKFLKGWMNRANDALLEANKCIGVVNV